MTDRKNLNVTDTEFKELKRVVNTHMNYGIEYNEKMNKLFAERLQSMIVKTDSSRASSSPKSSIATDSAIRADKSDIISDTSSETVEEYCENNIKFIIEKQEKEHVIIV